MNYSICLYEPSVGGLVTQTQTQLFVYVEKTQLHVCTHWRSFLLFLGSSRVFAHPPITKPVEATDTVLSPIHTSRFATLALVESIGGAYMWDLTFYLTNTPPFRGHA